MLHQHRTELIKAKAKLLDKAKMIRYEEHTGYLYPTDLGRVASNYYIKYDTVEVINELFKAYITEADIFAMVSHSQEFQQVKVAIYLLSPIIPAFRCHQKLMPNLLFRYIFVAPKIVAPFLRTMLIFFLNTFSIP